MVWGPQGSHRGVPFGLRSFASSRCGFTLFLYSVWIRSHPMPAGKVNVHSQIFRLVRDHVPRTQAKWMYLGPVYGSEEISKQMPRERFEFQVCGQHVLPWCQACHKRTGIRAQAHMMTQSCWANAQGQDSALPQLSICNPLAASWTCPCAIRTEGFGLHVLPVDVSSGSAHTPVTQPLRLLLCGPSSRSSLVFALAPQAADMKWRNIILGVQRQPLVIQVRLIIQLVHIQLRLICI